MALPLPASYQRQAVDDPRLGRRPARAMIIMIAIGVLPAKMAPIGHLAKLAMDLRSPCRPAR
jgi:hypothetical protein